MNKYELALVVSAKIEDDARTATVEKAKELINALIIDSNMQDKIPNGFKSIIPSGTNILNLTYDNNVIKIDFSNDLMNTSIENEELNALLKTIYNQGLVGVIAFLSLTGVGFFRCYRKRRAV